MLEQNLEGLNARVKRWLERTLEKLFAGRERVQVGHEKRINDEDSFKISKG